MGYYANSRTTTGDYNISIGAEAYGSSTGDHNILLGYRAMLTHHTLSKNIAIGHTALYYVGAGGSGRNIAIGHEVMFGHSSGGGASYNTAIGYSKRCIRLE